MISIAIYHLLHNMKNKQMVKEVQHILPPEYVCRQCGIVKLFCAYGNETKEKVWIDPGIIGVAALINNTSTYSSYIRIYELSNVLKHHVILFSSLYLKFFSSIN